jgi:hypothetical protein
MPILLRRLPFLVQVSQISARNSSGLGDEIASLYERAATGI